MGYTNDLVAICTNAAEIAEHALELDDMVSWAMALGAEVAAAQYRYDCFDSPGPPRVRASPRQCRYA